MHCRERDREPVRMANARSTSHSGGLESEQACVVDFVKELMSRHGVCDQTYVEVVSHLGEAGVVELTALVGYFVMVCWIMNVARTPGAVGSNIPALLPFPR